MNSKLNAEAYINQGNALYYQQEYAKATTKFARAYKTAKNQFSEYEYNKWGFALCEQSKYEEAIIKFDEALRLRPNYFYANLNLGCALYDLRRYKEAIVYFEEAKKISSFINVLYFNLGLVLSQQDEEESAKRMFEKGVSLSGTYKDKIECKKDLTSEINKRTRFLSNIENEEQKRHMEKTIKGIEEIISLLNV